MIVAFFCLLAFSCFQIVEHARAGDLLEVSWGPDEDDRAALRRHLADFKLDNFANTLEGIHLYLGSYEANEVEWNAELRLATAKKDSYCIEVDVEGHTYHRYGPGLDGAHPGACREL